MPMSENIKKIKIDTDFIKLGQLLKLANLVSSGAESKHIILDGKVTVNGQVCLQRGKKIVTGDIVLYDNTKIQVE